MNIETNSDAMNLEASVVGIADVSGGANRETG
jgi:hypothetical protein